MARITAQNYQSYMKGSSRHIDTHTREMYLGDSPTVQAGYGTYDSKETAHKVACYMFSLDDSATASTPCEDIPRGFTVAIEENNTVVEYQYKKPMPLGGYTSLDLEVKSIANVSASDISYNSSNVGTALTNAESDIQQLRSDIGTMSSLETTSRNLVGAINEVKDTIPTSMSAEDITYDSSGSHTVGSIAEAVAIAEGNIQNLDNVIGTGGSINSRISDAVAIETTRAQAAEADRYTKSETYTKEEVHNLITTPNQEYVSVTATALTTAITDVLPITGAADTIYRVGNWDGTQYNDSVFSEYAWNGSAYIKLSTKSQIGEVYDISVNHANTKYADLAAALGTNGANVPSTIRKGGMSIKFINSTTNKYEQWVLKASSFSTTQSDWVSVTNPKAKDVVYRSSNVEENLDRLSITKANADSEEESVLKDASDVYVISDSSGYVIAKIGNLGNGKLGLLINKIYNSDGKEIYQTLDAIAAFLETMPTEDDVILVDADKEQICKDKSDVFYITDSSGYIVAKIGNLGNGHLGLQINKIYNSNNTEVFQALSESASKDDTVLLNPQDEQIQYSPSNKWVILDAAGFIGALINSKGELHVNKIVADYANLQHIEGGISNDEVQPDFLLPSCIYVLDGVQRNLWSQSLMNRWNPYNWYLQFKGNASYQRRTKEVASFKSGNTDDKTVIANIVDYTKMKDLPSKIAHLKVGNPNDNSLSNVKVQFIGSSTVQLRYFEYALSTYVSNYELVGLRHKPNDEAVQHEGRGGAALSSYTQVSTSATDHFYPFMQPNGNHKYFGATGFWKNAKLCPNSETIGIQPDGSNPYYNGLYIASVLALFDSDGVLVAPGNGDIMFFTSDNVFKEYNGTTWITTTKNAYTWSFDYQKYLDMWNLDCPDVVCITLGSNDFRNATLPIDFTSWNNNMTALINSMKAANANIKVVICNQGPFGNYDTQGNPSMLQNYRMWLHLQDIIENFDNRQNENIYVLAQGSEISAEYGFTLLNSVYDDRAKVTELYSGSESLHLDGDIVHPMLSLSNMGIPIAAFLQYIRKI